MSIHVHVETITLYKYVVSRCKSVIMYNRDQMLQRI